MAKPILLFKDFLCFVKTQSGRPIKIQTTEDLISPIWIRVQGERGFQDLYFENSFYAFKHALKRFVDVVNKQKPNLSKSNTIEMVKIIEQARNA